MDLLNLKAIVFALSILSPEGQIKDDFLLGLFEDSRSCENVRYHAQQRTPEFFKFLVGQQIYGVPSLLKDGSTISTTVCHELNLSLLPKCNSRKEDQ